MIAAGTDNLFRRLAEALGHASWADEPRFASNPERVANRAALNEMIAAVVRTRPCAHWVEALDRVGVPCARLQTLDEVVSHPQTEALGMLIDTPDGKMRLMGLPISFDGTRPGITSGPVVLGADTAMILGKHD
jgi:crotonobetainyl-CoA:carnitine CoA-transferase CaiB-like acyl-CoA transferase